MVHGQCQRDKVTLAAPFIASRRHSTPEAPYSLGPALSQSCTQDPNRLPFRSRHEAAAFAFACTSLFLTICQLVFLPFPQRTFNMTLGNLVRLIPLKLNEVPAHAHIEDYLASSPHSKHPPSSSSSDEAPTSPPSTTLDADGRPLLVPFLTALLTEATSFIDSTLPKTFRPKGTKTNPPATASIEVLQRMISAEEISKIPWKEANIPRKSSRARQSYGEAWFARRSTHQNKQAHGTADWREFDEGLRKEHSEHEREYTPDVFDSYKMLDWDGQIGGLGGGVEGFEDVSMSGMISRFRGTLEVFGELTIGQSMRCVTSCRFHLPLVSSRSWWCMRRQDRMG